MLVSASIKNGGNLQGEFTVGVGQCQISTGDGSITILGSLVTVLIDAQATEIVQVPVLYIGAPGYHNVSITCNWNVTVTRVACWSEKGKFFTQSITIDAPYNYCLDYSAIGIEARESYLLKDKYWWSQHATDSDLSSMNLIGWMQLEWATSDQESFVKFVTAQLYNNGTYNSFIRLKYFFLSDLNVDLFGEKLNIRINLHITMYY